MKIIAYTALRYGKDYLGYAIRSVIDYVDEWHILYAQKPSHGHSSDVPCPETEMELWEIAHNAAGSKIRWHTGNWVYEGEQRNAIYSYAPDADIIISVDSDEIWQPSLIQAVVEAGLPGPGLPVPYLDMPFIHYWRSFYKCVLHDPAYPARVIYPANLGKAGRMGWTPHMHGVVNHMGYATRPEIVAYKWQIHGHKDELRRDVNWFNDVFMANCQFDCHPVGSEYWNPESVNPANYMPSFMSAHPFAKMLVIE